MPTSEIPVSDAIKQLHQKAAPVLFCDTCSLLDIIRLPSYQAKPTTVKEILSSANFILQSAKDGKISVVLPPHVFEEWRLKINDPYVLTSNYLNDLQIKFDIVQNIAHHWNHAEPLIDFKPVKIVDLLLHLTENIVNCAMKLSENKELSLKAHYRLIKKIPPGEKGSGATDCAIYEHMFHVMKELRRLSFQHSMVFITSNAKDYCEHKTFPKEPIKTEFNTVNAKLVRNWNWAEYEIFNP